MSQSELDAYRTVIGVIVVLVVRWASSRLGPNVGALILGLPLTSPLFLLCVSPTRMTSMLMLCSAIAAYPGVLVWKLTATRCRRASASLLAGAISFVAAALVLQMALSWDRWTFLICCLACMCVGVFKFAPLPTVSDLPSVEVTSVKHANLASPVMGYCIPVACWLLVISAKNWFPCGELLGGFPLITASALAGEWFNQGRAGAVRIANSFPYGQTSTIAFLATFGLAVPLLELTTAALLSYVAAAVVASTAVSLQRQVI